ncbi:MAG: hypothetical protein EHM61_15315 [Acidobacteria bacterium]|nr:MAG: hypothetical protein EHM61_15315 [Acidobacteriota bacterium]
MNDQTRTIRGSDRRRRPTPAFSPYLLGGRRRGPRRVADPQTNYYSDHPGARALLIGGLLFALSVLDAVLSLRLFASAKSYELNPLLAILLEHSNQAFLAFKFGITFAALLVLLFHWNFRILGRIPTTVAAYWLVGTYLTLIVYETGLLWW